MKPTIIFASRTGNTKKIADHLATQLNCKTQQINQTSPTQITLTDFDLIFIGTGIRAGNPNEELLRYLKTANFENDTKTFAVFITWGGAGKTDQEAFSKLKEALENRKQKVLNDYFTGYGGWQHALLRRGHPNQKDIEMAEEWAKRVVESLQEATGK